MWALSIKSFPLFLATFLALFVTTGIGNGSTFRMIPVIFRAFHLRGVDGDARAQAEALQAARRETAAVIGVVAAIGALGGYFIPRAFGASIQATGTPLVALACFVAFYVTCVATTWWCYTRTTWFSQRLPSLASARA
jgi:NNP family nitrate/nitrite transporter-like MFS transporter